MIDNDAVRYFQTKLAHETSPRDVSAMQANGADFVLIDVRDAEAFAHGRIPGSRNIALDQLGTVNLDPGVPVVVYCWGPSCNDATRGALALAARGLQVREMIGGFEYWVRAGLTTEAASGPHYRPVDHLTASHR